MSHHIVEAKNLEFSYPDNTHALHRHFIQDQAR